MWVIVVPGDNDEPDVIAPFGTRQQALNHIFHHPDIIHYHIRKVITPDGYNPYLTLAGISLRDDYAR
jgi:hypothetical protein